MPIVFRFAPHEDVGPELFVSKADGVITVDLGDNPDNGLSYSLWCTLHPCVVPLGAMEFAFWIADYDPATRQMDKIWNGADTKHLIVGENRAFIRYLICDALRVLVSRFNPQCVFMQTMAPNMPQKALAKYHELGGVLTEMGYEFRRVDPYHDYEAWLAKRMEQ